ncbi:MAG: succinylglutamate desuccinylase/aspartoacylase family protein [Myxococcales bacterium]|nr:succinylglutamate desuccinylase/aspartoacylase family protein [Myxococcales bacterium]
MWSDPDLVRVNDARVTNLASGCVHRVALRLAHDALGRPIEVPLLAAVGRKPGPRVGLTAAVHGNELNGVEAIHRLFHGLDVATLRGAILALPIVNVPGFLGRRRHLVKGYDLNHSFPGDATGPTWSQYAHNVTTRFLAHVDVLLDLHTASTGRVNTLYVRADMRDARAARLAHLQRPRIIVHSPPADGTLRGAASDRGVPAITVEIGNPQLFQRDVVRSSVRGIRAVLAEAGVLPKRKLQLGPPPIVCVQSGWEYTDRGGLMQVEVDLAAQIEEGDLLASLHDAWGLPVASYRAPHAGIVIGRSVDPVAATGARIVHLGRLASPSDQLHDQSSAIDAWRTR